MINFNIKPVSAELDLALQKKIDFKTKPLGSLGKLEKIAFKIGKIQNTLTPELKKPIILVFAGDHGIAAEGISLFPQEVTFQMALNFLNGGAGINVFTRQHSIDIKVIDTGVKHKFGPHPDLIAAKIAEGTKNFLYDPAMTKEQCNKALSNGAEIVTKVCNNGCNIIGFGEMGIGNTSSAAILLSLYANIPIDKCVGRGTGLDDKKLDYKAKILKQCIKNNSIDGSVYSILATFGGFEIVTMAGAMLKAAELGITLLIDGFITTAALLAASKICPAVLDYCIFTHKSNEQGHALMLEYLEAEPLLHLEMRLGEGTGAAVVYPIIQSAVKFLNEMATFDSANVTILE